MTAEAEAEKKQLGRPRMADDQKRRMSASMYLDQEEHAHFMAIVQGSGLSVSNFIRRACAEFLAVPTEEEPNVEKTQ